MLSFRVRNVASLAMMVSVTCLLSGCYSMNGYVLNRSGQSYYQAGNYTAAAHEFEQAAMNDPTNPDYLANLARARYRMGDTTSAEQAYRQALTIAPAHQPSYHGMAEVLVAQNRSPEAMALLQTWQATQPYVAESHVEMAWLQREMGQPEAAQQSLHQALQVNPNHSTALAHLGQYYQDMGRPDQAVALYQRSLLTDWNQPEVQSKLASAAQSAGATSPVGATAMARGMHPYQMAARPTAFGPPSPGAQYAQAQIAQAQLQQWQMAGMAPPATAMRPVRSGLQNAAYAMNSGTPTMNPTAPMSGPAPYGPAPYGLAPYGPAPYGLAPYGPAPYGPAPTGQVQSPGPDMSTPSTPSAAADLAWSPSDSAPADFWVDDYAHTPATNTAELVIPSPDPAFQPGPLEPVMTGPVRTISEVSFTPTADTSLAGTSDDLPVLEAF